MSRIQSTLVTAIAILLISCTWASRRVNVGEKFAMRPKEEVAVVDTGLTIRLNEVGHQTFSGPTPSRRAAAYAVLSVSDANGSRTVRLDVGEDEQLNDYFDQAQFREPLQ